MRYYIVDDNIATVKTIENIIKTRNLGTVCGYSTSPEIAIEEILEDRPEIVLVDFLMGDMDGVEVIERIKEKTDGIYFVMISKVIDKEMIQTAYTSGIEFFINKPVNLVEVETILNKLTETIKMKGMLNQLKTIMSDGDNIISEEKGKFSQGGERGNYRDIDHLLGNLGMLGERGCQDIRKAYSYMIDHNCQYDKTVLAYIESEGEESTKNIEQRIRRAIKKGLTNTANIMLDDAYSDIVDLYAHYVFDFSTVREEMNFIKGAMTTGGRVNISRFMDGLTVYAKD